MNQASQPGQQLPPSGWYQDPHNSSMFRFWDGTTWTAQTRPAQMANVQQGQNPQLDQHSGKTLVKSAREMLGQDRSMMLMPLISAGAALLPLAVLVTAQILLQPVGVVQYALYAVGLFAFSLIATFFSVALASGAMQRMNGADPTIGGCVAVARQNIKAIAKWALFATAVGVLLRFIEDRLGGLVALVIRFLGDTAFAAASYFVIPMLTHSDIGPIDALKTSSQMISKNWRRTVRFNLRLGMYGVGIVLGALLVGIAGVALVAVAVPLGVIVLTAGTLALFYAALWVNALGMYAKCALYRHANGMQTPGFSSIALQAAAKQRK